MEEMETLNGSCSVEITGDKLIDLTTVTSLKSSLTSMFRSSLPKPKLSKASSVSIIRIERDALKSNIYKKSSMGFSEEFSTELNEDDIDEYCERKSVANFQKNYLEMGQWPEVPVPKFQAFKAKYRNMKQKLKDCKADKEKAQALVKKYEAGEIPCNNCEVLKEKNSKTKIALEEAVQLSNLLLRELKRMEAGNDSLSY